jgi:MFS family permease
VNALVGGMLGQERTVLPLIATRVFHLQAYSAVLTYIVAFGVVKAATNFFAGTMSERVGRKPVLVTGWLIAIPVPFLLAWGPSWTWIVVANVLLGASQGLTWSTTVIMKIDLVGPERRGLAMGFNEAAGYGAVAVTALATGFIAAHAGLRPDPFFLGIAFAGLGLGLSTLFVRETRGFARQEAATHVAASDDLHGGLSTGQVFLLTSFTEKALSAASQAGMVNNLNDGLAWGIFPLFFARAGLSVARIGISGANSLGWRPPNRRVVARRRRPGGCSGPARAANDGLACGPRNGPVGRPPPDRRPRPRPLARARTLRR